MINENITIVLFAYNEENRIRYFLESVKNFCHIAVIDNFSEDKTVTIAREYTDQVFQYKNPGYVEHPDVVQYALSVVETDWIFWARVDEIPPLPLLKRLDEIQRSNQYDVVQIARLNLLFGHPVKTWGHDYQIAFFKKEHLDYSKNALYELNVLDSAKKIKLPATNEMSIWHFSSYDVTSYTNTNNRYSSITAEVAISHRMQSETHFSNSLEFLKVIAKNIVGRFQSSKKLTSLRLFINPVMRFFWHYIIRGGIRSGWVGFITSYLMMMEQMLTELKIWEIENGITLSKINNYYDNLKLLLTDGKIPELDKKRFL